MAGSERKEAPNLHILKLTFMFFAAGMALFLAAMVTALWILPELVLAGSFRIPKGWFLAHLLVLGWATMVAMGASYQITQVVMRTSLYSRTAGYIHYICYTGGFLVLAAGFLLERRWVVFGGSGLAFGVVLYAFNLAMTFIRKREWNLFVFGTGLSVLQLLLTVVLGITLGAGVAFGWTPRYEAVFQTHLWVGIAGWLSGLILVYSFKLLPMFLVSKKKLAKAAYWMIGVYHGSVWLQAASCWGGPEWTGPAAALGMAAALGWFTFYVWDVRRQRNSKHRVGTVNIAFFLIPGMYGLFLLWNVWKGIGGEWLPLQESFILILILGWFTPTILSYMGRILPFLWWAERFRTKEEKKNAVLLSDMLPEGRMTLELVFYLVGVALVVSGFLIRSPHLAVAGQAVSVSLALAYMVELARVFRY